MPLGTPRLSFGRRRRQCARTLDVFRLPRVGWFLEGRLRCPESIHPYADPPKTQPHGNQLKNSPTKSSCDSNEAQKAQQHSPTPMNAIVSCVSIIALATVATAHGQVMIGGGTTPPRPVLHAQGSSRTIITRVVFRQEVNPLNPYASNTLNCGADEPHVSEIATSVYLPPSYHSSQYNGCTEKQRRWCNSSSVVPVLLSGRSTCQRNSAFCE